MALLRDRFRVVESPVSPYRLLPVDQLCPDPRQPRSEFRADLEAALSDPEFLEFVEHLRAFGRITTPLLVRPANPATGVHQIIAGERRWWAAKKAGLTHVPVVIDELADSDPLRSRLSALAENFFRRELPLGDKINFFSEILAETGCTQRDLAKIFGISDSQMSKYLAIRRYPVPIREAVREGLVNDTETARALKDAPAPEREALLEQARATRQPVQRARAERAAKVAARITEAATPRQSSPPPREPKAPTLAPSQSGGTAPDLLELPPVPRDQLVALLRHHQALPESESALDDSYERILAAFLGLLSRFPAGESTPGGS
jgi:ParB family chromosome partitioning protein